jgi:hypothetical protein
MRTLLNGKRARYCMNCLHKNTFLALSESSGSRSLFPVFSAPILFAEQFAEGFGRVSPTQIVFAARTQRATLETFAISTVRFFKVKM